MTKLPAHTACVPLVALLSLTGCPSDEPSTTSADESSSSDPTTSGDPTTMTPTSADESSTAPADSSSGDPTESSGTDATTGTTETTDTTGTDDTTTTDAEESSTTGAACELVQCGEACIDPDSDPEFCGASGDCMGENAGVVCGLSAACDAGACVETCDNCSFETADFTGWTTQDLAMPLYALSVVASGVDPSGFFGEVNATDGELLAVSGFDGDGATGPVNTIELGQDITLRADAPADLVFDYRIAWNLMEFSMPTFDRTFEVHIEPEGGGDVLEIVPVETATIDTIGDTGQLTATIDLGAYAGDTIFINFVLTVPEDYTGPAQAEIDDVRIVAQ